MASECALAKVREALKNDAIAAGERWDYRRIDEEVPSDCPCCERAKAAEERADGLADDKEQLELRVETLKNDVSEYQEDIARVRHENGDRDVEIHRLLAIQKASDRNTNYLDGEVERLQADLADAHARLAEQELDHNNTVRSMGGEITRLRLERMPPPTDAPKPCTVCWGELSSIGCQNCGGTGEVPSSKPNPLFLPHHNECTEDVCHPDCVAGKSADLLPAVAPKPTPCSVCGGEKRLVNPAVMDRMGKGSTSDISPQTIPCDHCGGTGTEPEAT